MFHWEEHQHIVILGPLAPSESCQAPSTQQLQLLCWSYSYFQIGNEDKQPWEREGEETHKHVRKLDHSNGEGTAPQALLDRAGSCCSLKRRSSYRKVMSARTKYHRWGTNTKVTKHISFSSPKAMRKWERENPSHWGEPRNLRAQEPVPRNFRKLFLKITVRSFWASHLSGSNATPLVSHYPCRATLCRSFRLTFSQCRTRIALHPLKVSQKRRCRTRLGGGVSHLHFAWYTS